MTIVAISRPKLKSNNHISDYDMDRMEQQGFKPVGWQQYKDSPYAIYKKQMDMLKGDSDNGND